MISMADKGKRINAAGRLAEATVKRAQPFGKDGSAVVSRRRATAHGRARGNV